MKKLLIKLAVMTIILALGTLALTSCDLLLSMLLGGDCAHESVDPGNCVERASCNICGATVADFGDHEYVTESTDPTCENEGRTVLTCRLCGDSKNGSTVPALGHNYGDWVVVIQPTASTDGKKERTCTRCDEVESDVVIAHEHEIAYADAREVECDHDGWDAYEYCTLCDYDNKVVIKALGHDWSKYSSNGDGTHSRKCNRNSAHVDTVPCSGYEVSENMLPICEVCGSEYELAVRPGNSTYGYYALGTYEWGDEMQTLYRDLLSAAESFFYSNDDVVAESDRYVIGKFDLDEYSLTFEQAMAVWKVFYVSNPSYYWLDASVVSLGDTLLLTIADSFASASYRRSCDAEIDRITRECAALIKDGMTDLEKAITITAYIVSGMEYAYESDGETPVSAMWAHSMAGFAVHKYGVCEAYAKTFMYLCLLNGVDCLSGSGYAGDEAHAWNYVKIGDEWYGADITWTDVYGDEAVYDYFGLSGSALFDDHTSHPSVPYGVSFIYEAPELADHNIELAALYENGEYVGLFTSIDEALLEVSNHASEYMIDVGYYSPYSQKIVHSFETTTTPTVKKLTLIGKSEYVGAEYLDNNTIVYIPLNLILGSDLELRDVHLQLEKPEYAHSITLTNHVLTLAGNSVYIDSRVLGKYPTSAVIASTTRGAYIYGGVDIYRLTVKTDKIVLGDDSSIDYCSKNGIYVTNDANVSIKHYEY